MVTTNLKIDELRARLKSDPRSRLFYPLAEELRKSGQFDEAEQVLVKGLESHGGYLSAWMSMGRVRRELKKLGEAVEAFKKALSIDPSNVVAARQLAECYLESGEKIEAIKKFKLVHALLPSDDEVAEQIDLLDRELNPGNYLTAFPAPSVSSEKVEAAEETEKPAGTVTALASVAAAVVNRAADFVEDAASREKDAVSSAGENPLAGNDGVRPVEMDGSSAQSTFETSRADASPNTSPEEIFPAPPGDERSNEVAEPVWGDPVTVIDTAAPSIAPDPDRSMTETETMAELYASQGHSVAAADIYRRILERDPGNSAARGRLEELAPSPKRATHRNEAKIDRLQKWSKNMAKNVVKR